MPAKVLVSILVVVALLAGVLWAARDSALVRRWGPLSTSGADPVRGTQPRKCVGADRVVYTDGACPTGTQTRAIDGGSLSVLPAAPVAATPVAPASAPTPLRRLAGDGVQSDQNERRVEQALQR